MVERVPMTPAGHAKLEHELKDLRNSERPAVIKAIAEARAHGDLSENAEYHAARDKQSFIEGRIMELEDKLGRAEVIDPAGHSGTRVVFGAKVKLVDEETDEEVRYQIVGPDESDVANGMLSVTSPVARALIGKDEGDSVEVTTPGGTRYLEIINVSFG